MILFWYKHRSPGVPLVRVLGLTLVKRSVLAAQAAGFERIVLAVDPADEAAVRDELQDPRIRVRVTVESSAANLFEAIAGDDDAGGAAAAQQPVIVLGDRTWAGPVLARLAEPLPAGVAGLGVRGGPDGSDLAGMLRLRSEELEGAKLASATEPEAIARGLAAWSPTEGVLETVDGAGRVGPIGADDEIAAAERVLLEALEKPADGVISRNINRKISLFISRRLARTGVRPNEITAVVALVGVLSGPFAFFGGPYWGFVLGALCYYLSAILDGCDGEISRLKYQGSPLGAWLDTVVDDMVGLSYILGLYARLYLDAPGSFWLWTGAVGVVFYLLTVLPRYYIMAVRLGSGDYQKLAALQKPAEPGPLGKLVQPIKDVIFRTDFLPFYAFVTALAHYTPAFAVPFAAGSVASAVDTLVTLIKTRKMSAD
jgi:1L-myo-inositol 1-phosphate cytidylyltransferase / CDP-L-myo-inositol myo-inositolphosphotransferase